MKQPGCLMESKGLRFFFCGSVDAVESYFWIPRFHKVLEATLLFLSRDLSGAMDCERWAANPKIHQANFGMVKGGWKPTSGIQEYIDIRAQGSTA